MSNEFKVITSDFVNLGISLSNHEELCSLERRFKKDITIQDLKGKLELMSGGCPSTMSLQLYDKQDKLICALDNNNALLGSFPVENGMRIHIIDKFVMRDEVEDLSKVDKFELTPEEYANRTDTVKSFLERNRLGKYNEEETRQREEDRQQLENAEKAAAEALQIGDRCEIRVPGNPVRRATIMFVGEVDFKKGWWIGIKYDEPLGKNDGLVSGKRYFECLPKYGGFVKPCNVTAGDFPEEEMDLDEI